jgi:hypothetical protein
MGEIQINKFRQSTGRTGQQVLKKNLGDCWFVEMKRG